MRHISLIFLLAFISAVAFSSEKQLININAEGKVKAQPDMAIFNLTIQTTELDAQQAHTKVDSQVKELLRKLKKFDVKEGSLDSSQVSIHAEYDYQLKPKKLLGYRVSRQISFNLINLKQLQALSNTVSKLEFTSLNNIQFSVQDKHYFEDLALINAIQLAKQKAELIANEFNVSLGRLNAISHQVSQNSPPVFARAMATEDSMLKSNNTFEQKEIEMRAFIEVSFEFK